MSTGIGVSLSGAARRPFAFVAWESCPQPTPQDIHVESIDDVAIGSGPIEVIASASSGLDVTLSAVGPCTLSGTSLTLDSPGTCTVTASQAGDSTWAPAQDVTMSFEVLPAPAPPTDTTTTTAPTAAPSTTVPGTTMPGTTVPGTTRPVSTGPATTGPAGPMPMAATPSTGPLPRTGFQPGIPAVGSGLLLAGIILVGLRRRRPRSPGLELPGRR